MLEKRDFYINGQWVAPDSNKSFSIINPSTGKPCAVISLGNTKDADRAINAAIEQFPMWSKTCPKERLKIIKNLTKIYKERSEELAQIVSMEMGAPIDFALSAQVAVGLNHLNNFIETFENFSFERPLGFDKSGRLLFCPIGPVGLITPWNWPLNQIILKTIAACLAGCTMVLKPSEIAPLSGLFFVQMLHDAGLPAGVCNLINGTGEEVGVHMSSHPELRMISFTGSTHAGKSISYNGAESLKRITLELGGKGANLIFADADEDAVARGVRTCFSNTGQSCNAPTRMLVEHNLYQKALIQAKEAGEKVLVDKSNKPGPHIGPVVSAAQYQRVQDLIQAGIDEGAKLLIGGTGKPEGLEEGFFVKPTIFYDVTPQMRIFKEEVFGPVLCMMPFETEEMAIHLANQTEYGLTNYIQSQCSERCARVSRALESGMVEVNGRKLPRGSFFGGVKHSGYAREGCHWGIEEFLYSKAIS